MEINERKTTEVNGVQVSPSQEQWLQALQRRSHQARSEWKSKCLQLEAILLSVAMPLSLGSIRQGPALFYLCAAALSSILSLILGSVSLYLEMLQREKEEQDERTRILCLREEGILIHEAPSTAGEMISALFALSGILSLLLLWLSFAKS